jgi:hypothetical protein
LKLARNRELGGQFASLHHDSTRKAAEMRLEICPPCCMGGSRIGHEDHFGTPLVRASEGYVRNPGSVRPIEITPGLSECNCTIR